MRDVVAQIGAKQALSCRIRVGDQEKRTAPQHHDGGIGGNLKSKRGWASEVAWSDAHAVLAVDRYPPGPTYQAI
eukprot:3639091-Rhodomonas_salina.4